MPLTLNLTMPRKVRISSILPFIFRFSFLILQSKITPLRQFSPMPRPTAHATAQAGSTVRELCTSIVSHRFPNYVCKNDYELLTLAGGGLECQDPAQIRDRLSMTYEATAKTYGSEGALNKYVEKALSSPLAEVTGVSAGSSEGSLKYRSNEMPPIDQTKFR